MRQIADWPKKLGLEEYTQCFAENAIDISVLPNLTDQDLEKKLGILHGHRRKMLRAIAEPNARRTRGYNPVDPPRQPAGMPTHRSKDWRAALGRLQIHSKGRAGRIG